MTVSAPRELARAVVLVDGARAGTLDEKAEGVVAIRGTDRHIIIVRANGYADVIKHVHGVGKNVAIRVLRDEVVRTSAQGGCRCERGDFTPMLASISSTAIFVGRVVNSEPIPVRQRVSELTTKVTFAIEQSWAGPASGEIAVSTWRVGSRYCGLPFERGGRYLVWAWGNEGMLLTDACSRTRLAGEAADDLVWLEGRRSREPVRRLEKLAPRDRAVIEAVLAKPDAYEVWCSEHKRLLIGNRSTSWFGMQPRNDEQPEEVRMAIENTGPADVANAAPELVAELIARNDRERARLKQQTTDEPAASVTLPAFNAAGDLAVIYVWVDCGESAAPAAFVFLRHVDTQWRVVAWTRP